VELFVRMRESAPPGSLDVEVVERKGLGHPDTICDGVAEHISVRLCRYYVHHFGEILHHNVDKVLLVGGAARPSFGGGAVTEPLEIYLAGRVTEEFRGARIPVHDIAVDACREWMRTHLRLNVDHDVRVIPRFRRGSTDLIRLFDRDRARPLANDTSCGAGFAPLSGLERVVLEIEQTLNRPETKQAHPEIGEDIKVMGIRRGTSVDVTVACAFVSRFVSDVQDYIRKKNEAQSLAVAAARRVTALDVNVVVNAADDAANGNVFLTVTGTSAEAGDDGEAGRGNRACGLITPYRAMTLEAAAGKNPVNHVGKLYNLVAGRIAGAVATQVEHVVDAECILVSQIGREVSDPQIVDLRLACTDRTGATTVERLVHDIVRSELGRLPDLRDALLDERITMY
jgi:S-adenosylmethionine synthetase